MSLTGHAIGTNWRWFDGRLRVQYDPTWCQSMPYKVYIDGTAQNRLFHSLGQAAMHYRVMEKDAKKIGRAHV